MADTGALSPGTMADDDTIGTETWSNPDNAKTSDDSYASVVVGTAAKKIYAIQIVKSDGNIGSTNKSDDVTITDVEQYISYGAADDLWDESWSPSDINNSNFGVVYACYKYAISHYLKATNFGFAIPSGATIDGIIVAVERYAEASTVYVDHIRITVYYTEHHHTITAEVTFGHAVTASRAITTARSASVTLGREVTTLIESGIGSFLCIGSLNNNSIRTNSNVGASWVSCAKDASGDLPSAYLAQFENHLCALNSANAGFAYSAANDIVSNWTSKPNFPNLPSNITGMFVGRDASDNPTLYFLTPQGMYYLDVFTNFVFGPTEVTWEKDLTSGKKGLYWRGATYVAVGKGIYQIISGVVTPIGPDMDDGMPEDLQGVVTDMVGVGFWLVIALDGGNTKKSCILKRYLTGKHWHPVRIGSVNTPIRALMWDSGTLYFGEGTDVKSLPFPNVSDNVTKIAGHTYAETGYIIYPKFHSDFESMSKVAHKVRAVTKDCNANEYITVSYRIDEDTAWTELGTFKSSPRPTALSFPASGDSVGVSFESIQLKADLVRGSTTTNSPKIESFILEYRVTPPVLWGFDFNVMAMSQGDQSGQDIIDALKTAIETGTLMSFYPTGNKNDTEYFVEMAAMPGTEKGTEFGNEGIYSVSVSEAID